MITLDRNEINEINVRDINVAVTNGDPFAVETEEHYNYITETLDNAETVQVLSPEDDDFTDWALRLDYAEDAMPCEIFVADNNRLAFTIE